MHVTTVGISSTTVPLLNTNSSPNQLTFIHYSFVHVHVQRDSND